MYSELLFIKKKKKKEGIYQNKFKKNVNSYILKRK